MAGAGCVGRWAASMAIPASLLLGLIASRAVGGNAATRLSTTRAAQTQPVDLAPEVTAATRLLTAGDAAAVPTAVLWLGSERDGILVGQASPRLRFAFHAVRKFQVAAAVPWLVAIYDDPTAERYARNAAAEAAIRIDPFYSQEFLNAVLDDQLVAAGEQQSLSSAQCAAAAALAQFSDERAQSLLVRAMIDYLDGIDQGGPISGKSSRNFETALAISRLDNVAILSRLRGLRSQYRREPAAGRLNSMIAQLQTNHLPVEKLLTMAASEKNSTLQLMAILALGSKAGVEAIPVIQKVELSSLHGLVRFSGPGEAEPATRPATRPASRLDKTSPDEAHRRTLLTACRDALSEIAARTPVRVEPPARWPMTTNAIEPTPPQPIGDDAELVFIEDLATRTIGGGKVSFAVMTEPQGLLPLQSTIVRNPALYDWMKHLPYGQMARASFTPGRVELLGIRLVDHAAGETTRDGYQCAGFTTVKEGRWENQALQLRKLGRDIIALIPNRHKSDGTLAPDAAIMNAAESINPGQAVIARFEPGPGPAILQSLSVYHPSLPAFFSKLTSAKTPAGERPAVELFVARRRTVCLLPSEDQPPDPSRLDAATLATLPASTALKVVLDDTVQPPQLLSIGFDGGIAQSSDGQVAAVRMGRALYLSSRRAGWHGTFQIADTPDRGWHYLAAGIDSARADPTHLGLQEKDLNRLSQLARDATSFSSPQLNETLPGLISRWAAAEPGDRPAIERDMDLQMCGVGVEAFAREETLYREARRILSPWSYREMMALGQTVRAPAGPDSSKSSPTTQGNAASH